MERKTDFLNHLKKKKILIYGTGVIAKRLIKMLQGFNITGIIDRVQFIGEVEGIPIKMWDELQEGDADIIIIAALPKHYREIYNRIVDRCIAFDMKIYSADGQNLISYYGIMGLSKKDNIFFNKNAEELFQKICSYEAVSFDLFDTLIMRKNLEPFDLFDIVDKRIKERGIFLSDYKKVRRKAELMSKGGDIYKIYSILQELTFLSKQDCSTILQEEIKCEREYIVPRKKMVDMMKKAIALGKKVNIVTNMYLPEKILADILKDKGITGYEKIYVSCDYGVSKGNGLFREYLEEVKAKNYLHIGDDTQEDIVGARKYGIDTYEIKSAYDMLKISNLRNVLAYAGNSNEKGLLGLLISELFNNPFALFKTNGIVEIADLKLFGKVFVAPIVICYMINLIDVTRKYKNCHGILFGSRDGYLLKKLYDRLCNNNLLEIRKKPSWYFMTSRKLSLKVAMKSEENIKVLKDYKDECGIEEILTNIFELSDVCHYDEMKYLQLDDYYLEHKEQIFNSSNYSRENYYKYINHCGIKKDEKYLLCELTSQGTVQYGLNQIFDEPLYGFYLCKRKGFVHFKLDTNSCFQEKENDVRDLIENNNFLESILTAPEPSVVDMDESGKPVFAVENREIEEIKNVMLAQKGIEEFFFEYISMMFIDGKGINKTLPQFLLKMYKEVWLTGECKKIENRKLNDDLGYKYYIV